MPGQEYILRRHIVLSVRYFPGVHFERRNWSVEAQLFVVVLLSVVLVLGGAIGSISWRDRTPASGAGHGGSGGAPKRSRHWRRPSREYRRHTHHPATSTPAAGPGSGLLPQSQPPSAPHLPTTSTDGSGKASGPPSGDEGIGAAREALRANQLSMGDPRLSTLDRVQALMSSPAFALHLAEQPPTPDEDDKRDPRSEREPL